MYSQSDLKNYSDLLGVYPGIGFPKLKEAYEKKVNSLEGLSSSLSSQEKKQLLVKIDEAFQFLSKYYSDHSKQKELDCCWETLGIPQGSSVQDIKKAFKKIAISTHPDLYPTPESNEKFKAAYEAYQMLTAETLKGNINTGINFMLPLQTASLVDTSKDEKTDYWAILELPKNANLNELKKAYLKKLSTSLPNKGLSEEEKANDETYTKAYKYLYSTITKTDGKFVSNDDFFCDFIYSEKELKFIPKLNHSKSMGIPAIEWEKED